MRYWFFNGNDVVGPFTLKELTQQKAFSETSLVCPENFSDDQDHWQVAATFAEFKPFFEQTAPEEENTVTLDQELDTLLKERSPLAFDETPSDGPRLQIPNKPAKPGPIEDYFNRVKEEDLGDILGIPNPEENSDMDLAHALEKQLAKTSSTRREKQESNVDEQTALELTQASATHHVASATEVFGPPTQLLTPPLTAQPATGLSMPTLEPITMPVLTQDPVAQEPMTEEPVAKEPAVEEPATTVPALQEPASTPTDVQPLPVPAQATAQVTTAAAQPTEPLINPDPALLRAEKVEVNSVRARLKQTQEIQAFLHETQNAHFNIQLQTRRRIAVMLLAMLAIIAGMLLALQLRPQQKPKQPDTQAPVAPAIELLEETPAPPTAPVVTPATPLSPEQKALALVQNYSLGEQRGKLVDYLSRMYKTQLAQGYNATWEAEPLYKNSYIVKYRLTKTRKEPIIYVFQADVAQGKLTAALNNISLDLVGKIN